MIPARVRDQVLRAAAPVRQGRVSRIVGIHLEVEGVEAGIGEAVRIELGGGQSLVAEVVGFEGERLVCMPLREVRGVRYGDRAVALRRATQIPVGRALLGRVIDADGVPIDGQGPVEPDDVVGLELAAPMPMERTLIDEQLGLGVRVLDTMVPCGVGQRLGVFAGAGVGKSSLLSMVVRGADVDVRVVALVGERGREVREFLEHDLGPEGMARSVVVVATSDEPPLVRVRAAIAATRIAEWFRASGARVLLVMDSLTRLALAQRELGLSAGEPPSVRGYPPSVFRLMAQLLERAGTDHVGSITGIYSVLVEGDDLDDPIADAARSVLDGHIVLSRQLANRGRYPAVDVLASLSRLESSILPDDRRRLMQAARRHLAVLDEVRDLVDLGAYQAGTSMEVDEALEVVPRIETVFGQDISERSDPNDAWSRLAGALGVNA
ncbi:ATPase, FliI/YscN family [Acidimicrobium ferrooxidans DSM 10331]|uniref:ATPase, FliI/YscN family n=1 Tax=Acidimicrobium ferrooxidans (strain DSM 10331 / JCM 15462 / NBRC 103882 / ICP) TaxID=525909 RepID=C7M211_ACIFD|nr:FliI/YscN family ATPase [Acidimicrobium ferrooxidans]ACU53109.1 ATPase, FliI/YscN family [Acidimicrobium ferrooxidans DSM 10331]